jgi:hypothetical protein
MAHNARLQFATAVPRAREKSEDTTPGGGFSRRGCDGGPVFLDLGWRHDGNIECHDRDVDAATGRSHRGRKLSRLIGRKGDISRPGELNRREPTQLRYRDKNVA